ncbi:hypothetical protein TNCV_3041741, partial [Trichonephila clavipes]
CGILEKKIFKWHFLEKAKKQDLVLLAEESEEKSPWRLRNQGGKIARQHAIQQLRWESELNELRLEIESIRSNVKRTGSCAEDRRKGNGRFRGCLRQGQGEQEMVNAVIDTVPRCP